MPDITTLFAGGALVGLIAGFWTKIKSWLLFMVSLAIEDVHLTAGWTSQVVLDYLVANHERSKLYTRTFSEADAFDRKTMTKHNIFYESIGYQTMLFWMGRTPLIFASYNQETKSPDGRATENRRVRLRFIRGTVDVDALLRKAQEYFTTTNNPTDPRRERRAPRYSITFWRSALSSPDKETQRRGKVVERDTYSVYRFSYTYNDWTKHPSNRLLAEEGRYSQIRWPQGDSLQHLYYPEEVLELIEEMRYWLTTKEWHLKKRIPWKRGWLLHGKPGTGKTALARAFAQDLDLPIHVFELANMTNSEFQKAWETMAQQAPCIALIEDIDSVFHGRTNVTGYRGMFGPRRKRRHPPAVASGGTTNPGLASEGGTPPSDEDDDDHPSGMTLTFDTLINALDGVEQNDGIFTIFTTNELDKIDPALGVPDKNSPDATTSTRPGRVDRAIELTYMLPEHKLQMARWILDEFPDVLAAMEAEITSKASARQETPAQFQERCSRLALREKFRLKQREEKWQAPAETEPHKVGMSLVHRPETDQTAVKSLLNGQPWTPRI